MLEDIRGHAAFALQESQLTKYACSLLAVAVSKQRRNSFDNKMASRLW